MANTNSGKYKLREHKEGSVTPVKVGNKVVLLNHGTKPIKEGGMVKTYGEIPVTTSEDLQLIYQHNKALRPLIDAPQQTAADAAPDAGKGNDKSKK